MSKSRRFPSLLAASALMLGATGANAALIDLTGGTAGTMPAGSARNDLTLSLYGTESRDGFFGSQLTFAQSGSHSFTLEYLGKEAGFVNSFSFDGNLLFSTDTSSAGDTAGPFVIDGTAGALIPFTFSFNSGAGTVVNGANPGNGTVSRNFFATCVSDPGATRCDVVDLFLDDGGSAKDGDYDDIGIRLTARAGVSEVPEPASLGLLGLGLLGLGFGNRLRKRI